MRAWIIAVCSNIPRLYSGLPGIAFRHTRNRLTIRIGQLLQYRQLQIGAQRQTHNALGLGTLWACLGLCSRYTNI